MKNRVIIYAPNIHTGGGLVLLQGLIEVWPKNKRLFAYFDERAFNILNIPNNAQVTWVAPRIINRMKVEMSLGTGCKDSDLVVCLNSLPPLFKFPGNVIVFLQNRNLVEKYSLKQFSLWQAARILLERILGYFLRHRVDEYIVQTNCFKRDVEDWHASKLKLKKPLVKVLPFMKSILIKDKELYEVQKKIWDFIYVADALGHKNHITLLDAWAELAKQDIFPSLALTIDMSETELLSKIKNLNNIGVKITNLGILTHEEIIEKYQECGALIYPSLRESFGLPLVEASSVGLPILASELDYVHDVCRPTETFDPNSFRSITRAVKAFLNIEEQIQTINPPIKFLDYIFSRTDEGTFSDDK
jgi:glycosyltransferase involved in cell wall biosynthesis